MTTPRKLSREELLSGEQSGVHSVTHPITGYKKIEGACMKSNILDYLFRRTNVKVFDATAEIEIPSGTSIVKSHDGHDQSFRTEKVIVKNITGVPFINLLTGTDDCMFYSIYNNDVEYIKGETYDSKYGLDLDPNNSDTRGINFVMNKDNVDQLDTSGRPSIVHREIYARSRLGLKFFHK